MKETPYILDGDDEADVQIKILEICGFEFPEDPYNNGPELFPSRKMLESQLNNPNSKLMKLLNNCKIGYLEYLILGAFILKAGATLPEGIKEKILKTADWETDKGRWDHCSKDFKSERKRILEDFQYKVKNHKPGKITRIL